MERNSTAHATEHDNSRASQAARPLADAMPPPVSVFLKRPDGRIEPAQFLLSNEDLIDLLRLADSGTRFPICTIQRYRKLGLQSVRIGKRVWYRLDDVVKWLDEHHTRLRVGKPHRNTWHPYAK